ncbi:MAG: hypothetical protein OEV42_17570 [Deltaproteobacteria bacterium]|nr:hypothetical protein [Deltaproteobacteria bacterium]
MKLTFHVLRRLKLIYGNIAKTLNPFDSSNAQVVGCSVGLYFLHSFQKIGKSVHGIFFLFREFHVFYAWTCAFIFIMTYEVTPCFAERGPFAARYSSIMEFHEFNLNTHNIILKCSEDRVISLLHESDGMDHDPDMLYEVKLSCFVLPISIDVERNDTTKNYTDKTGGQIVDCGIHWKDLLAVFIGGLMGVISFIGIVEFLKI